MVQQKPKTKESPVFFAKVKEADEGVFRFIGASTLPDRTRERLPDGRVIKGEILSKNTLEKMAGMINDSSKVGGEYGSYRTISLFHDRVYQQDPKLEEAGYVRQGSAKVEEIPEHPGNYGLYVDVEVNEMYQPNESYPDYTPEKIKYKIGKDALGLSVEYNNLATQEKIVDVGGDLYRYILDTDDFRGFGFARPNVIGNTSAIRVKEIEVASYAKKESEKKMEQENQELKTQLEQAATKVKELETKLGAAKEEGATAKVKELETSLEDMNAKFKEMKLQNDETAAKIKESIELAFSGLEFNKPSKTKEDNSAAKVKEIYAHADNKEWVKFKESTESFVEKHGAKIKEYLARSGPGFDFEAHQTLAVKCKGSQMVVVPTAKTKATFDTTTASEDTYSQTNAMFSDRYVAGITETFLKEDGLLTAIPKEQHIGGNDFYQWRIWIDYTTVTGTNTLAVDPNTTSVTRTVRKFEKLQTRICEYRDGVEVTDFTQAHSMASVGDLLAIELNRGAEAVTESMNADLFKGNTDNTTDWNGFVGLLGVADSSTYGTLYGKTRSATNRLLDSTLANTYVSTSEAISVSVVRSGYEKVLAQGSKPEDIAIVMHPTQVRRLFDTEDAAIRYGPLTRESAPPAWGFSRVMIPYVDGIPVIRDYRCESSASAADMFAVVDLNPGKGFVLVVSKPLGARGLAKVGTSESAYVSFWGATVYKSPRNVFVHDSLTAT